jgi:hypothetical protein
MVLHFSTAVYTCIAAPTLSGNGLPRPPSQVPEDCRRRVSSEAGLVRPPFPQTPAQAPCPTHPNLSKLP